MIIIIITFTITLIEAKQHPHSRIHHTTTVSPISLSDTRPVVGVSDWRRRRLSVYTAAPLDGLDVCVLCDAA